MPLNVSTQILHLRIFLTADITLKTLFDFVVPNVSVSYESFETNVAQLVFSLGVCVGNKEECVTYRTLVECFVIGCSSNIFRNVLIISSHSLLVTNRRYGSIFGPKGVVVNGRFIVRNLDYRHTFVRNRNDVIIFATLTIVRNK